MNIHYKKKVAIAGATGGIGLEVAKRFRAEGADVVICSEPGDKKVGRALRALRRIRGGKIHHLFADWADLRAPQEFVSQAYDLLGGLDILVANVGIYKPARADEISAESFTVQWQVNVRGHFLAAQAFKRLVKKRSWNNPGKIIFTGSINGWLSEIDHIGYDHTKADLLGLLRSMTVEWTRDSIFVHGIAPGLILTDLTSGLKTDKLAAALAVSHIPIGFIASPKHIADLYLLVASPAANLLVGSMLDASGGIAALQMPATLPKGCFSRERRRRRVR